MTTKRENDATRAADRAVLVRARAEVLRSLSATALALYRFIVRYKRDSGGNSPTISAMLDGIRIVSVSKLNTALDDLVTAGLIVRTLGASRGVSVVGETWRLDRVSEEALLLVEEPQGV